MIDWNDLRFFLELSRQGRLTAAAQRMSVDHTTVARRIGALEAALNTQLFDKSPRGYKLTDAGQALLPHAEAMESQSIGMLRDVAGRDTDLSGAVRLATPEGIGSQFIARHLHRFRADHPGIGLELIAETRPMSLSKREADIAITLGRPESGRLICRKLADYRLQLYASPRYLKDHPPIRELNDLGSHNFIWYVDDLLQIDALRQLLQRTFKDPNVVFHSTNVNAQCNAAISGIGLALLHCFHADLEPDLVPVLPGIATTTREIWLVVHEDLRHVARVDAVCRFLSDLVTREKASLLGNRVTQKAH